MSHCLIISCRNEGNKQTTEIDTINIVNNKNSVDSSSYNIKIKPDIDISGVLYKISNKKLLDDLVYNIINDFLCENSDESKSEEVGYALFEYLKKNKLNNNTFLLILDKKEVNQKNRILNNLVQIMCIDLGEENYTYENFVTDFELFKNNASAKKAFEQCMINQIE